MHSQYQSKLKEKIESELVKNNNLRENLKFESEESKSPYQTMLFNSSEDIQFEKNSIGRGKAADKVI